MNTKMETKLNGKTYNIEIDSVEVRAVGAPLDEDQLCARVEFRLGGKTAAWIIDAEVRNGTVCRSGMPEPRIEKSNGFDELLASEESESGRALAWSETFDVCEAAAMDAMGRYVNGAETVEMYFENRADDGEEGCPVDEAPGWTVERHAEGLCVCSPGACARELNYRDESNQLMDDILRGCGVFGDLRDYDTGEYLRHATREEMEMSLALARRA